MDSKDTALAAVKQRSLLEDSFVELERQYDIINTLMARLAPVRDSLPQQESAADPQTNHLYGLLERIRYNNQQLDQLYQEIVL